MGFLGKGSKQPIAPNGNNDRLGPEAPAGMSRVKVKKVRTAVMDQARSE